MKRTKILYWVFTILFGGFMLMSAIPDIILTKQAVDIFNMLKYPLYISPFLGIAKTLGVIALFIPGYPRLKEWAYAGLMYDLAGATYSIYSINPAPASWLPMLPSIIIGILSYIFYHKRAKLLNQPAV